MSRPACSSRSWMRCWPCSVRLTLRCFSSFSQSPGTSCVHQLVDSAVELRAVVGRAADDQRRARLVDQDRIDLVDDREVVPALDHLAERVAHVVAQIVEAELVVGAVGDVAGVGLAALRVVQARHDHADAQPEQIVDGAHPAGVAAGEVVVDGDDVHALALEGVEVGGERGDQRLALAGLHLGDAALVQDHAADQLDVEVALAQACAWRPRAPPRTPRPAGRPASRPRRGAA